MIHNVPKNLNHTILYPLLGWKRESQTEENFHLKIYERERVVEKSLAETFAKLNITAIVKSDPYSLPFQKEIIVPLHGESYANGPYEIYRIARKFVKPLLDDNLFKIRFYVWMDIDTEYGFLSQGRINYHFRYYEHY